MRVGVLIASSGGADPRIDEPDDQVDEQVHPDDEQRQEDHGALDHREVLVADPLDHAKTVWVMMAPPRSWPNCRPSTVITGMHALRNACFTTTRPSASPLARAVLMNSMFITSITPERTRRMVMGASAAPRQNAGSRKFCQVPYPDAGRSRSRTEKTMMSMMPSQKMGAAWPATATTVQRLSTHECRRSAAIVPSGSAITIPTTRPARVR